MTSLNSCHLIFTGRSSHHWYDLITGRTSRAGTRDLAAKSRRRARCATGGGGRGDGVEDDRRERGISVSGQRRCMHCLRTVLVGLSRSQSVAAAAAAGRMYSAIFSNHFCGPDRAVCPLRLSVCAYVYSDNNV